MEKEQVVNQEVETQEVEQGEQVEHQEVNLEEINETLEKINVDQDQIAKDLDARQKAVFEREIKFALKENGLEAFADIINPKDNDELNTIVAQLLKVMNEQKIANSYQPKDNATQDALSVAQQKGDTKNMIASKLANLFK